MRNFENYIFGFILAFCLCSCFHTSNVGKVLKTTINSVEGAGRFVIGLAADIKILQGKKLLDYIKKYDKKHIQKL